MGNLIASGTLSRRRFAGNLRNRFLQEFSRWEMEGEDPG
jgi:hypothetical protein